MKDKYNLTVILVPLNKENALVSETTVSKLLGCSPSCLVTSSAGTQKTVSQPDTYSGQVPLASCYGTLVSVSKALLTHGSFVLSVLVVLQGRKTCSLGRTCRENRSCVSSTEL